MNDQGYSMGRDDISKILQERFGEFILAIQSESDRRIYIDIAPQSVERATRLMLDEYSARLQIATGVDTRDGVEVMYHWALDKDDCVITFRTLLDHDKLELNSIAPICPAAEWIEREIWELLGINFIGHPDMRHLLLAEDWPDGDFPMRRNREARP